MATEATGSAAGSAQAQGSMRLSRADLTLINPEVQIKLQGQDRKITFDGSPGTQFISAQE